MSEYQWKTVSVVGFDELMQALDRADRKGYMPDAIKEEWEAFNWKPEQPAQQEPVAWMQEMPAQEGETRSVRMTTLKEHATLEWGNPIPLYTSPPQRKPLTDEDCTRIYNEANDITTKNPPITTERVFKAMRAAHGIKENT